MLLSDCGNSCWLFARARRVVRGLLGCDNLETALPLRLSVAPPVGGGAVSGVSVGDDDDRQEIPPERRRAHDNMYQYVANFTATSWVDNFIAQLREANDDVSRTTGQELHRAHVLRASASTMLVESSLGEIGSALAFADQSGNLAGALFPLHAVGTTLGAARPAAKPKPQAAVIDLCADDDDDDPPPKRQRES